jgi:hypothetical protein
MPSPGRQVCGTEGTVWRLLPGHLGVVRLRLRCPVDLRKGYQATARGQALPSLKILRNVAPVLGPRGLYQPSTSSERAEELTDLVDVDRRYLCRSEVSSLG